jgi:hypothetical protein
VKKLKCFRDRDTEKEIGDAHFHVTAKNDVERISDAMFKHRMYSNYSPYNDTSFGPSPSKMDPKEAMNSTLPSFSSTMGHFS